MQTGGNEVTFKLKVFLNQIKFSSVLLVLAKLENIDSNEESGFSFRFKFYSLS